MDLRLLKKCTRLVSSSSVYFLYENQGCLILKTANISKEEAMEDYRISHLDILLFEENKDYFYVIPELKQLLTKKEVGIVYFNFSSIQYTSDKLMKVYSCPKRDFQLLGGLFPACSIKEHYTFALDTNYLKKVFRFFGKDLAPTFKVYLTEKYLYFKNGEYEVYLFLVESSKFKSYLKEVN